MPIDDLQGFSDCSVEEVAIEIQIETDKNNTKKRKIEEGDLCVTGFVSAHGEIKK